jgi:hypothetical protein
MEGKVYPMRAGAARDFPGVVQLLIDNKQLLFGERESFQVAWLAVVTQNSEALSLILKGATCEDLKYHAEHATPDATLLSLAAQPHPFKEVCLDMLRGRREGTSQSEGFGITLGESPELLMNALCSESEVLPQILQRNNEMVATVLVGFARCGIKYDLELGDFHEPPLVTAARHGNARTIRLLLTIGARVTASNQRGQTALHIAAQKGFDEVTLELLEAAERRTDLALVSEQRDVFGRTPADVAYSPFGRCILGRAFGEGGLISSAAACARAIDEAEARAGQSQKGEATHEKSNEQAGAFSGRSPEQDEILGGWRTYGGQPPLATVDCPVTAGATRPEFSIVDGKMDSKTFVKDHVMLSSRPALFKGVANGMAVLKQWTPSFLSSEIGGATVRSAQISEPYLRFPYLRDDLQSSRDAERIELGSFITEMVSAVPFTATDDAKSAPKHVDHSVDDLEYTQGLHVKGMEQFDALPMLGSGHASRKRFHLGPAGSGSAPSFNAEAVHVAVAGRRRWFVWPPTERFMSGKTAADWLLGGCGTGGGAPHLEFIQEPGDAVYIPENTVYAVVNLEDTVAISLTLTNFFIEEDKPEELDPENEAAYAAEVLDLARMHEASMPQSTPRPACDLKQVRDALKRCVTTLPAVDACIDDAAQDDCVCMQSPEFVACAEPCYAMLMGALCDDFAVETAAGSASAAAIDPVVEVEVEEATAATEAKVVADKRAEHAEANLAADNVEIATEKKADIATPDEIAIESEDKGEAAVVEDGCDADTLRWTLASCMKELPEVNACVEEDTKDDCDCLEADVFVACAGECYESLRSVLCE